MVGDTSERLIWNWMHPVVRAEHDRSDCGLDCLGPAADMPR